MGAGTSRAACPAPAWAPTSRRPSTSCSSRSSSGSSPSRSAGRWTGSANAGQDDLHFVWAGSHRIDEPHYFRLEGPVTLVEFDNTEDNANHVHCVWRDPTNDFGVDILAQHRAAQHAGPASSSHDG